MTLNKRIVGIDFGMKRIGIAISDPLCSFATPLEKIERTGNVEKDIHHLLERVKDRGTIETFVMGLPLHLDGNESQMSAQARAFAHKLEEITGISCSLVDERLSSKAAETLLMELPMNRKRRSKAVDAISASLILQSYLDLTCCNK